MKCSVGILHGSSLLWAFFDSYFVRQFKCLRSQNFRLHLNLKIKYKAIHSNFNKLKEIVDRRSANKASNMDDEVNIFLLFSFPLQFSCDRKIGTHDGSFSVQLQLQATVFAEPTETKPLLFRNIVQHVC